MNGISLAPWDPALKRLHTRPITQQKSFSRFSSSMSSFRYALRIPQRLQVKRCACGESLLETPKLYVLNRKFALVNRSERSARTLACRVETRLDTFSSVMKFKNKRRESLDAARTSACATSALEWLVRNFAYRKFSTSIMSLPLPSTCV